MNSKRPIHLGMLLVCLFTPLGGAFAQVPDLFQPAPANLGDASKKADQLRKLPGVLSLSIVQIDTKSLQGASVRLNVTRSKSFLATKTRLQQRGPEDYSWYGKLDSTGGTALFVVKNGAVTGTISSADGVYQVRPIGGGNHALTQVDSRKLPPDHPPSFRSKEQGAIPPFAPAPRQKDLNDQPAIIELLVAYTPAVLANRPDAEAMIQLAVDEANTANENSGVTARFHLAHTYQTSYTETGDFDTDLSRFRTPGDGFMDEVHGLRDARAADVAVLIVDDSAYCGLASDIMAKAGTAFAAVYHQCATGYYSFAHEIGHLMGARHNPEADSGSTPFAYGHGYQYLSSSPWRTIMAYDCASGCPRLQFWSSPNFQHNGQATGTGAMHDNARVLNGTAATVAAFRPSQPTHFWSWSDQGTPPNARIEATVGVLTVMDSPSSSQRPYAFVKTTSGHLWVHWWNGSQWSWSDQGTPPGLTITGGVGVLTVMDSPSSSQRPYAFVRASNGHLWVHWWNGSRWNWSDQGTPPGTAISAPVGVLTVMDSPSSSQRPYAFVRTSNSHLWVNWWDGSRWNWSDQGTPPRASISDTVGVLTVKDSPSSSQRPYAFVRTSNGHLWVHWWDGSRWNWSDQGTPPSNLLVDSVGALTVMDSPSSSQRPYAFVRTSNDHLWVNWWH